MLLVLLESAITVQQETWRARHQSPNENTKEAILQGLGGTIARERERGETEIDRKTQRWSVARKPFSPWISPLVVVFLRDCSRINELLLLFRPLHFPRQSYLSSAVGCVRHMRRDLVSAAPSSLHPDRKSEIHRHGWSRTQIWGRGSTFFLDLFFASSLVPPGRSGNNFRCTTGKQRGYVRSADSLCYIVHTAFTPAAASADFQVGRSRKA